MCNEKTLKEMSNNNYLDKVYTVYEDDRDQRGDESDRDQRRGEQEFYDAISDPAALRNAMDPISEQVKLADLTQTPIPPLFADRATSVTTGTVPYSYNGQGQQTSQATSRSSRQVQQNAPATPVDKVLAICTTFLATVPAIGLDEIKFKGSQEILHFTKLPENLK